MNPIERFWSQIDYGASLTDCWLWKGKPLDSGYAHFRVSGKHIRVHRFSYEHFIGPIPQGYDIDHTCHNKDLSCNRKTECDHRRCANPSHLEAVTKKEHAKRGRGFAAINVNKTACKRGHPFTPNNTYTLRDKSTGEPVGRSCRRCSAERCKKYHAKVAPKISTVLSARGSTTGFRGVFQTDSGYRVLIRANKAIAFQGRFKTLQEAVAASAEARKQYMPDALVDERIASKEFPLG